MENRDLSETVDGMDVNQRAKAKKDAEDESRKADQKQHADKLLQGFAKIDDNAPNRAIWELVQNACDLAQKCEVTINYNNNGFSFTHNGEPFTSKTLIALIKQVSSKGEENSEQIGKFGTGFITTHAFGRKIEINSLLNVNGQYIRISNFLIDRTPVDWEGMVKNLQDSEREVYKVIENGKIAENTAILTTLTYLPQSPTELEYIKQSYTYLQEYIPIVLAISDRLVSVTVIGPNAESKRYIKENKKVENDIWVTTINTGTEKIRIFSLQDIDKNVEVILPLRSEKEAYAISRSIAKLFLYYPLIGTENWGCNYIIHSGKFKPSEERDGIHLQSNNLQVQKDEEENRELIATASQLIFDFVLKNADLIDHPAHLASVEFEVLGDKPLLSGYFKKLRDLWVAHFKVCKLVETESAKITPAAAVFLDRDLLLDETRLKPIYRLAKGNWKDIPQCHLLAQWAQIRDKWEDATLVKKGRIQLVENIQISGNLNAYEKSEDLHSFYDYLLISQFGDLFNTFKLLPNIDGEFRLVTALNSEVNLSPVMIDIARVIAPEIPGKLINESFKFSFGLTPYKRSDYSKDITDHVTKILKENSISGGIDQAFFHALLDYCRIATTAESTSVSSRMIKLICSYYNHPNDLIPIPASEGDEIENRTAQKRLLEVFLNDIASHDTIWVKENLVLLESVISTMSELKEYKDLLQTAIVFPNRLNEVCLQAGLKIDGGIPDELKQMYDRICKPNLPVDATLVHPKFQKYLIQQEKRTAGSLGSELETTFSHNNMYGDIIDLYRNDILRIIELITTDDQWADYFPHLNIRKANVMLDTVSGTTKGTMFKIMKMRPEKVEILGKLSEVEDLEGVLHKVEQLQGLSDKLGNLPQEQVMQLQRLIESGQFQNFVALGLTAWDEEQRSKADFDFKYAIGKRIESIIRGKVDQELVQCSVKVQDIQNGQDIVVEKNGDPFFYIEVKSRWKPENSIMMSRNQFMRAADNKNRYSLCCVEMSDYKTGQPDRYLVDNVDVILDRIKFVNTVGIELEPLVHGIFRFTDTENQITLTGDYKATIPQRLVKTGVGLDTFVQGLTQLIIGEPYKAPIL